MGLALQQPVDLLKRRVQAKGDLLAGLGANDVDRLAAGSLGQVLIPDPSQSVGMQWVDLPTKNVRWHYGVNPSGTAASITAALQDALDDSATWGTLEIPEYLPINDTLTEPVHYGKIVQGTSREAWIEMTANNRPIIQTTNSSHSNVWRDIGLSYQTQQTNASHPNSTAFSMRALSGGDQSQYHRRWQNVRIHQATRGIGVTSSNALLWGSRFDDLYLTSISHTGLDLAGVGGMPSNSASNCQIINTNSSVTYMTGPAVRLVGAGMLFATLAMEGCNGNVLFEMNGGSNVQVFNLHVENYSMDEPLFGHSFPRIFDVSDGPLVVRGGAMAFTVNLSASYGRLFAVGSGGSIDVSNTKTNVQAITAGAVHFFNAAGTAPAVWLKNNAIAAGSAAIEFPCAEWDLTSVAAIKQWNGWMAPEPPATFAGGDTTPSVRVSGGEVLKTNVFRCNANGTITTFDDGVEGQEITVLLDGSTTLVHGATLKLAGGSNLTGTANDVVRLVLISGVWYETGRSVNG